MLLFHHFSNSHSSFALNTSCIHPPTLCFTLGRFWPLQALIYRKLLYPYHCTKNIPPVALLTWNLTALFLGINFIRHFSMKEEWFPKSLLHSNIVDFFIGFLKVLRSLCKLCPSLQRNTHMLFYQFQIIYDTYFNSPFSSLALPPQNGKYFKIQTDKKTPTRRRDED